MSSFRAQGTAAQNLINYKVQITCMLQRKGQTMKAIVYDTVGGPEVLKLKDVPIPEPKSDEVLIKVKACALNRLDYYLRIEEDDEMPMPHIMGSDISGVIEEIREPSTTWQVGDEVIVAPSIETSGSSRVRIVGYQTQGGYAQYVTVPVRNLIPKPKNLTFEEAASIPLVNVTAYHLLFTRGKLRPGEVVLVMGANSGIGSAAIQLCRAMGAYVISTARGDKKITRAREIGADEVIDLDNGDWTGEVLRLTENRGVDLVCEHFGGDYIKKCLEVVAPYGRIVTIGSTVGDELNINISDLYRRQISILGSYMGDKQELSEVMKWFEWGRVRPVIARVFQLEEAAKAHMLLESRDFFGKIVLTIPD